MNLVPFRFDVFLPRESTIQMHVFTTSASYFFIASDAGIATAFDFRAVHVKAVVSYYFRFE